MGSAFVHKNVSVCLHILLKLRKIYVGGKKFVEGDRSHLGNGDICLLVPVATNVLSLNCNAEGTH